MPVFCTKKDRLFEKYMILIFNDSLISIKESFSILKIVLNIYIKI